MFKVVQLQNSKESAGKAAQRLHYAFLEGGVDSTIISLEKDLIIDDKIKYLEIKARITANLDKTLQGYRNGKTNKQFGSFSLPILGTNVSGMTEIKNADIIYLHWTLGGFLNLSNIEQLLKLKKPVIIILHDMWYITGGCYHSFTCEKYISGCYDCQIFQGNKKYDLSTRGFNKKLKLYPKYNNLYFVSPSRWMLNCAKKSAMTKNKPVFYIPNVLDTSIFKPFPKLTARQILNLDPNETVIAFGAVTLDSAYKGWAYLQIALQKLYDQGLRNVCVLIFGGGHNKLIEDAIPFKTKFMGYLRDEYSTSLVYNAADVFIAPSLAEAFGYVIMEALSCGTPVVGFNTGGIPDSIEHKVNGYLANYKDSEDLARGISYCIEHEVKGKLLPGFETSEVVKKHIDLISNLPTN
jgi:glycosyltransferase involved in cell wall biosynthesis